jgi:polyphosphate kinase
VSDARPADAPASDAFPTPYLDRQASELEYMARVLAHARDEGLELLDRVKFVAIFASLVDEFFRVRVAGLMEQHAAGVTERSRGGNRPAEELSHLRRRHRDLAYEASTLLHDVLLPALADEGVLLVGWEDLDEATQARLTRTFEDRIFPVLTPLAVGPANPFPFISDLSLSIGVELGEVDDAFARIKVPGNLDRFLDASPEDGDGRCLIPVERVIAAHLHRLFPGREVVGWHTFRVTRNADYEVEDVEVGDLLDAVAAELRDRRFGHAVRIEVSPDTPVRIRELLKRELKLDDEAVLELADPLDHTALWELHALDRPDLRAEGWVPRTVPEFEVDDPGELFSRIREQDLLVQHPYDSFVATTQRLIETAVRDPRVLAIKQTLYRTSGDSPIVHALIDAAHAGKQAVALIELKARFDEAANIEWASKLEEAGVHVVYGFVELKTHTKVAMIIREDEDGVIRRYGHIATGNYNPSTARNYEDLGLFTADEDLTSDLGELFNFLTGHSDQEEYRKLLVAPVSLKDRLLELIREQARPGGRIVIKVNHLSHTEVIDALYDASAAGAEIDLIVRTICCLRPGVEGLSERIRVRSIVGRFLEHSRIYRFGQDPQAGHYLIGSADLMPRNLDHRVEAVAPVEDAALRAQLDDLLDLHLRDDRLAWTLASDGTWTPVPRGDGVDVQAELAERARNRARA